MKHSAHNDADILPLGRIVGTNHVLGMTPEQRSWHMHVIGATGSGKSKFLEHLIRQDILENRGLCLMDPEGELAENILAWVSRIPYPPKNFLYIAPWRDDWTIVYNPLARAALDDWFLVNQLKRAVAKCWGADNTIESPMLDLWLKTCIYTGVRLNLTLPEIGMLLNPTVERNIQRRAIIDQLPRSDVDIRSRWEQLCYFAEKKPSEFEASAGSTIRRLAGFLDNPRLRRIFGVPNATLDLAKAMDEGAVIIVDLSTHGRIDEGDVMTFGTLLLTDFFTQMQLRQTNRPFTLYVDEFQDYATKDISRMLDRSRKRGLQLVLSHQRPGQLLNTDDPGIRDVWSAIQNNCRTKIVFGGIKKPDELKEIASVLSLGALDPFKIKDELYSTKVINYVKEYWESHTRGTTSTTSTSTGSGSTYSTGSGSMTGAGAGTAYGQGAFSPEILHTTQSQSWSNFVSSMNAGSDSQSESESKSTVDLRTESPVLVPVMGEELSARYYLPLEEQLYQFMAIVSEQQQRQAMVRIDGQNRPVPIEVPYVKPIDATEEDINHQLALAYQGSECYFPVARALELVQARQEEFQRLGHPVRVPIEESNVTMEDPPPMASFSGEQIAIKVGDVLLSARDVAIFIDVFENRFISIKHAAALHWPNATSDTATKRRLSQLTEAGLLRQEDVTAPGYKVIYRLTKDCVDLLTEHNLISETIRDGWNGKMRSRYTDRIGPGHLPHELKLYDLKVILQASISTHPQLKIVEFAIWPLPYVFEVIYKGRRSPQKPDGFLHIRYHPSPNEAPVSNYFYIEFDHRRSEARDIIVQKLEKYHTYLEHGFGHFIGKPDAPKSERSFRVLIIVDTADSQKRRDNICAKLAAAGIGTLAYVSTFNDFATDPLQPIWLTPKNYADAGGRKPVLLSLFRSLSTPAPTSDSSHPAETVLP